MLKGDSYFKMEGDSVLTCAIDSVVTVIDQSDSLYIFFEEKSFVAYCIKQSNTYRLLQLEHDMGAVPVEFIFLDINKDGIIEYVTLWGGDPDSHIVMLNYRKKYLDFYKQYSSEYDYYVSSEDEYSVSVDYKRMSVKNNKLYLYYGFAPSQKTKESNIFGMVMKYGVFQYSKDQSKEVFFCPMRVTSLKQWLKFTKQ